MSDIASTSLVPRPAACHSCSCWALLLARQMGGHLATNRVRGSFSFLLESPPVLRLECKHEHMGMQMCSMPCVLCPASP